MQITVIRKFFHTSERMIFSGVKTRWCLLFLHSQVFAILTEAPRGRLLTKTRMQAEIPKQLILEARRKA